MPKTLSMHFNGNVVVTTTSSFWVNLMGKKWIIIANGLYYYPNDIFSRMVLLNKFLSIFIQLGDGFLLRLQTLADEVLKKLSSSMLKIYL